MSIEYFGPTVFHEETGQRPEHQTRMVFQGRLADDGNLNWAVHHEELNGYDRLNAPRWRDLGADGIRCLREERSVADQLLYDFRFAAILHSFYDWAIPILKQQVLKIGRDKVTPSESLKAVIHDKLAIEAVLHLGSRLKLKKESKEAINEFISQHSLSIQNTEE